MSHRSQWDSGEKAGVIKSAWAPSRSVCRLVNKNRDASEPKPAYLQRNVNQLSVHLHLCEKRPVSHRYHDNAAAVVCRTRFASARERAPSERPSLFPLVRARCHKGMLGMQLGDEWWLQFARGIEWWREFEEGRDMTHIYSIQILYQPLVSTITPGEKERKK